MDFVPGIFDVIVSVRPDKLASTPGKRSFWRKRGVLDPAADAEGGAGCVRSEEEGEGEGEREEEDVWAVRRSPLAASRSPPARRSLSLDSVFDKLESRPD